MTYRDFDEWLDEIENYGTRRERLLEDIGERGLEWVRTAWILGAQSTVYTLKPEAYDALVKALDEPAKPNARLKRLMRSTPSWDETQSEVDGLLEQFKDIPEPRPYQRALGQCEAISTKMLRCQNTASETRDERAVCKTHKHCDYPLTYCRKG